MYNLTEKELESLLNIGFSFNTAGYLSRKHSTDNAYETILTIDEANKIDDKDELDILRPTDKYIIFYHNIPENPFIEIGSASTAKDVDEIIEDYEYIND